MMNREDLNEAGREAVTQGKQAARQVEQARPYQVLVKVGLVTYGVLHLIIGWLAFRLTLGHSDGEASNTGALRQLAATQIGLVLMWITGVGLLALVVWQLIAALVGYREYDGIKRIRKRASALARTLVFGTLGVAALRIAVGARDDDGDAESSLSAGLFGLPGGRFLVAAIGLGIIGYAVWQIVKGVTGRYNEEIETELRGAAKVLAMAGHLAKGTAFTVMGSLFIWAAMSYDAEKAGGLDDAITVIRDQPAGSALLIVLAVGIAAYGLWCFMWARHAKHA